MSIEIKNLVNSTNNEAVNTVLVISKQDAAIKAAINALNNLVHTNRVEFEEFGQNYGIGKELLDKIYDLKDSLDKAHYGRF